MNIYEKLLVIQNKLKAPKSQYNTFSNYNYRNCEDILEAVKPLLVEVKATLTISDELVMVGERYYVKATATLIDVESNEQYCNKIIHNAAFAREEETKKGMDSSQITGASSSYARKYALNGLFAIDDTKDSDFSNNGSNASTTSTSKTKYSLKERGKIISDLLKQSNGAITFEQVDEWIIKKFGNDKNLENITDQQFLTLKNALDK